MALDFTIRVVSDGKVRVLTPADISASIMAAGYAPGVGLTQLRFVIERTIRFLDTPPDADAAAAKSQILLPAPEPTPPPSAA